MTFTDAWPALLRRFPELEEQAVRFASPPIRNSATLCGNLANGSPIGDSIPGPDRARCADRTSPRQRMRRLALEDFYLGYQSKDLSRGEFLVGVAIPAADSGAMDRELQARQAHRSGYLRGLRHLLRERRG